MIRRNRLVLSRAFQAALLSLAAPAAIQACSSDDASSAARDGGVDATQTNDAQADTNGNPGGPDGAAVSDAGKRADADASEVESTADADAGAISCWPDVLALDAFVDAGPDAAPEEICVYDLPCGLSTGLGAVGCDIYNTDTDAAIGCRLYEGRGCFEDAFAPESGGVTFWCIGCASAGGRRPRGMRARAERRDAESPLGAYFAQLARLEAASVDAFYILHDELEAHDAPASLVRATVRCAKDEVRHARITTTLARAHRSTPRLATVRRRAPRTIEALARENAVEGCVRETFGALVAHHQAARAEDPRVARALARIARDETRHAAVAWAIAQWADSRLDAKARRRVAAARARAVRALRNEAAQEPSPSLVARAGLPRAKDAALLLDSLAHTLWSDARAAGSPSARG